MSWNILRDPDDDLNQTQGMLHREDGSWATVSFDGTVIDVEVAQRFDDARREWAEEN